MSAGHVLALCGGVGGAKLAFGLTKVLPADQLTIAVNTGDDFEHLGLSISPDLDTVAYTLADLSDRVRGWGLAGETWQFMSALRRLGESAAALEWLAPGQSGALSQELTAFLAHQEVLGWVLAVTMLFFSSQAFTVLESAISVIFLHRVTKRPRPVLASYVLIPLGYILVIGAALLVGTMVLADVVAIGEQSLVIMGHSWSLGGPSRFLLYLAGVVAEILLISSIYYFMPVGRLSPHRALIGGTTAGLLWEIIRHVLGWYFTSLSQVNVVYGSLTTAVVVLLSLEIAAALLLLGAQVIAEYENIGTSAEDAPPVTLKTEAVKDKT